MITEEEVNKAMQWLVSNADKAAEARANRLYLEDFSRVLKAEVMSEHLDEAVNAQQRYADADARYKTHLLGLKVAIAVDERYKWLKETALTRIEIWRTHCSNMRGIK